MNDSSCIFEIIDQTIKTSQTSLFQSKNSVRLPACHEAVIMHGLRLRQSVHSKSNRIVKILSLFWPDIKCTVIQRVPWYPNGIGTYEPTSHNESEENPSVNG